LAGRAALIDDKAAMRLLCPPSLDALYPEGFIDANMIVIELAPERIEMQIRGVTPEPWGHVRTLLQRGGPKGWHLTE
jgi:hypothetical protein